MNRGEAITRIQDGLGFATRQGQKIVLRLQEAQRDLEQGKTLPRFLAHPFEQIVLATGDRTFTLPSGFLRIDEWVRPYYVATGTSVPTFLTVLPDYPTAQRLIQDEGVSVPRVMVIVKDATFGVVDFILQTDRAYTVFWSYYKAASALANDGDTNEWLKNAPEWLIGEAGYRMAKDLRDKDAAASFDDMRKTARAACFGEIIATEESYGPLVMGENL